MYLDLGMYWYNFKTEEWELIVDGPSDYAPYLPQSQPAQALYVLYQKTGKTPAESAIEVLTRCAEAYKSNATQS